MQRSITNTNSIRIKLISIKGFEAFSRIYQNAKKYHSDNISIAYIKPEKAHLINNKLDLNLITQNSINLYYGVTISKKNCKKAVVRNRIKRLLREALAHFFIHYHTNNQTNSEKLNSALHNAHIVLSARYKLSSPSLIHLKDIQPEVNYLLGKILNQK